MSTSRIGRAIKPKTKVNPEYGKQEQARKEEVDRIERALTIFSDELGESIDLVKKQNEAVDLILGKIQNLENRILKLEESTKNNIKKECEELKVNISQQLDSYKKEQDEAKKSKSWFK